MNELTEKILRSSGRENLTQSVWDTAKELVNVTVPIEGAFHNIFSLTASG